MRGAGDVPSEGPRHLLLFGPTGAGKSDLAMRLAERFGLEIVGVDAFHVYRGLDIGTAKPTAKDRARVRHHLIDVVAPTEPFTAGSYLSHAEVVAADLARRDQGAVWVGGTGLYFRVLRQGLAPAPPTDPAVRAELESRSVDDLRAEIERVDPAWAATADLNNPVRLVRALAVWRQTGCPLSRWQQMGRSGPLAAYPLVALVPSRDLLRRRVEERFEAMRAAGWEEEVRHLLTLPGWKSSGASRAIGYRAVAAVIRGQMDWERCRAQVVAETMAYAKRQLTWLRREDNFRIIEAHGSDVDESSLAQRFGIGRNSGRGDWLS